MPFLPAGVGAAVAGGVASAAVGAGISALSGSKQSGNVAGNQPQVQNQLMNLQPQFDTALANETAAYQPYSTGGTQANVDQANLLGLNGQPAADAAMAKLPVIAWVSVHAATGLTRRRCRGGCGGHAALRCHAQGGGHLRAGLGQSRTSNNTTPTCRPWAGRA